MEATNPTPVADTPPVAGRAATAPAVLARLRNVRKSYGAVLALHDVDLSLRAGEVLAVLGSNGAGKSTAVGLLLGMASPDAGEATLFDLPPGTLAARRGMGVMLQSAGLPDTLCVDELLALVRSCYDDPLDSAECIALVGLEGLQRRRYGALSGGQQRRVQFALAICGRPRALFLDEPTTGLDVEARQGVWRSVRALVAAGCGVLLTTHYLEEAEALADRVVVLHAGRVVAEGSVATLRAGVALRQVRCISTLDAREVGSWPGVRRAHREGAGLEIATETAEAVVALLLARDPDLQGLEVRHAGLADAFARLSDMGTPADGAVPAAREAA